MQEKHSKHFKRIEHFIKSVAPYFEKFQLQLDRLNEERINLEWREITLHDIPFNTMLSRWYFPIYSIRYFAYATRYA